MLQIESLCTESQQRWNEDTLLTAKSKDHSTQLALPYILWLRLTCFLNCDVFRAMEIHFGVWWRFFSLGKHTFSWMYWKLCNWTFSLIDVVDVLLFICGNKHIPIVIHLLWEIETQFDNIYTHILYIVIFLTHNLFIVSLTCLLQVRETDTWNVLNTVTVFYVKKTHTHTHVYIYI